MRIAAAHPLIALGIALGALCCAQTSLAQPTGAPPPAVQPPPLLEASERFQRGVASFREGDFDAALAEFSRAYKLSPNYRLLYNLAQVQAERHDSVAALKLLEQYVAEAGDALDDERRANVAQLNRDLQRHITELRVSSNVSNAQLAVDGVVVGRAPLSEPLWVNAGSHTVRLTHEGYAPSSKEVSVAGGLVETLDFELVAQAKAPALQPLANPRSPASSTMGGAFWTSVACASALTAAATSFGILTHLENRKLDTELDTFPVNQRDVTAERKRVKSFALLTDVFGASAILAVGSSVVFAIRGTERPAAAPASSRPRRLRASLTGTGVLLQGEF